MGGRARRAINKGSRLKSTGNPSGRRVWSGHHINMAGVILVLATITFFLILYVGCRVHLIQLKYSIQVEERTYRELLMENRKLTLEWATLTSPKRLKALAEKRLGLHTPDPKEVIVLP